MANPDQNINVIQPNGTEMAVNECKFLYSSDMRVDGPVMNHSPKIYAIKLPLIGEI